MKPEFLSYICFLFKGAATNQINIRLYDSIKFKIYIDYFGQAFPSLCGLVMKRLQWVSQYEK